ncbi:MAG TPA: hypothetical protein VM008_08545 [Phycisphaerae bacterium]|nr:hypothetical protein [Phycisphaerae bacterium]
MQYRCVAVSREAFVQQLANYVSAGFWRYVSGSVPLHKNPADVDRKLVGQYGIDMSKWARSRRKKAGGGNVHYLRHERTFVLLVSPGPHPILGRESTLRDLRRAPFRFHGYSIGCGMGTDGRWHASIRIHAEEYRRLKMHLLPLAVHQTAEALAHEFQTLPFVPYARVRRQLLNLLRAVNRQRRMAGLELIPFTVLTLRRTPAKVFEQ